MIIRRNDTVVVISGKDKGKKGKVRFVHPREETLIVDGINFIKRHARATRQARQAGVIELEAPVHVSKVMLLCDKCSHQSRIGFRFLEDGKKVRFCKECQEVID
jgi:large subunit ribosomal protein L24